MSAADNLSEERRLIRQSAEDFAKKEVLPAANKLDSEQGEIPKSLLEKMGAMGFFGILIPKELGGLGLGVFEYCLVAESLSRGWMSVGSLLARGNAFYKRIPGEGALRDERIRAMAEGNYLGAYAISEAEAGSDVAGIRCRAERDGESWILDGNKYWCTFADGADFIYVVARTGEGEKGKRHLGLTGISVEKEKGSFPKGMTGQPIPKIGYFGWKTWELRFDDLRVPYAHAGEEGRAFYALAEDFAVMRAHTAARAVGLAQAALEDAIDYAKARRQFGEPIASFQAIRFKIAKMASQIEAARALLYSLCEKIDAGEPSGEMAAQAKYIASEMAERVTSEALQILGGAGYTTLHAVERYWRDARLTKIFEGSSEIMLRIISDDLLGRPPKVP